MSLLVIVPLFMAPAEPPSAAAHEKSLAPQLQKLAVTDVPKSVFRFNGSDASHWQSTMVCPASVRGLQRDRMLPFDGYGFDVGCNFSSGSGDSIVTVYLTRRRGQSLDDDLGNARAALEQRLPDAKRLSGEAPAPKGMSFKSALYEIGDGRRTGAWVADVSGWTFKFRATYEPAREGETLDAMSELTEKTRATASAHLAACAAAPPVTRPGALITDKDRLTGLSLIASVSVARDEDGKKGEPLPEQWCAEEGFGDAQAPMLLWRNIASDGSVGPVDRFNYMTVQEPPILNSEANPVASLVDEEKGPLVHQLTLVKGDTTHIFAFFEGRPSSATLAPIGKDIALGKKGPIASVSSGSNTITLPVGN